ncbi:MAG: hypothetical protein U5R31_13215 [Acidimicrobiia bacterium]|nr:hypothetical protein [Acidimicrobiia bacterium]
METISHDEPDVRLARINLTAWVENLAEETAAELGMAWRGSPCAPSTIEGVVEEFRAGMLTGLPVRVSNRFCETTIYVCPKDNVAFRFVHDSRHYFLRAGFETEPELLVASCHLARLQRDGYPVESVEHRLLYADTVGQALFLAETGSFVENQLRFALRCLTNPLQEAIRLEFALQQHAVAS